MDSIAEWLQRNPAGHTFTLIWRSVLLLLPTPDSPWYTVQGHPETVISSYMDGQLPKDGAGPATESLRASEGWGALWAVMMRGDASTGTSVPWEGG